MLPVAILAGGLATRLRPLTDTIPKSLVEVAGEPFLHHQLRLLRANGVERVVLCVGHLGEMVRESVGDGREFGLEVGYSFDGPVLLGTAGALARALPQLGPAFFVLYGDSYLPCCWADVERAFVESGKSGLMTVCRNDNQWDASNVEFADGQLLAYSKTERTPRMRHIDYGLGVFRSSVFAHIPQGNRRDLADVYGDLLREHDLAACEVSGRFYEIGSVQGIQELGAYLSATHGIHHS
jgi:N-acetyl-alpha-D-muramate 1-phosphate uridylyltransferase